MLAARNIEGVQSCKIYVGKKKVFQVLADSPL